MKMGRYLVLPPIIALLLLFVLRNPFHEYMDKSVHNYFQPDKRTGTFELAEHVKLVLQRVNKIKGRMNHHEHKPTRAYEETLRSLESDFTELMEMSGEYSHSAKYPRLGVMQDLYRLVASHIQKISQQDGYLEYRRVERAELGSIVQKRIEILQNPTNCANAKKLLCTVDKHNCGFGCIVHHVIYCLITAYATSRTLILNLKFKYSGASWDQTFLPLSTTCLDSSGSSQGNWDDGNHSAQVLSVGTFETMGKDTPWAAFLPPAIPSDIAPRLERVSSDPVKWWVGQFATYILRLTTKTAKNIQEAKSRQTVHNTPKPKIVTIGLHVRRTDKISEAKSQPLEKYIERVEEYIAIREKVEGSPIQAKVFLASDEPKVIQEARKCESKSKLKWKLFANESNARKAETRNRFKNGIFGILTDVMLLADCEFVVCTYSSNICLLVAELKEAKAEAEGRVVSLDYPYHFIAMSPATYSTMGVVVQVTYAHTPTSNHEIELKVGDLIISMEPNLGNGMSYGINQRNNQSGLYPTFKTTTITKRLEFPKHKFWSSTEEF